MRYRLQPVFACALLLNLGVLVYAVTVSLPDAIKVLLTYVLLSIWNIWRRAVAAPGRAL